MKRQTPLPPFSNEEKAFPELIARIIVRISFEESYQKDRNIIDDEGLK